MVESSTLEVKSSAGPKAPRDWPARPTGAPAETVQQFAKSGRKCRTLVWCVCALQGQTKLHTENCASGGQCSTLGHGARTDNTRVKDAPVGGQATPRAQFAIYGGNVLTAFSRPRILRRHRPLNTFIVQSMFGELLAPRTSKTPSDQSRQALLGWYRPIRRTVLEVFDLVSKVPWNDTRGRRSSIFSDQAAFLVDQATDAGMCIEYNGGNAF